LIGLNETKAPGLRKPGAFLWLIRMRQFDVRGVAVAVFGDQLWAWFKR
jgi:hypothetical protein